MLSENLLVVTVFISKAMPIRMSRNDEKKFKIIGQYLKELRLNSGMTQELLAEELNLHVNSISRIENGHNFTIKTLFLYSYTFNINPSEILSILD